MLVIKYIKKVSPYFKGMKLKIFGSIFFGVVLAGLKSLQAYIVKPIFDQGLNPESGIDGVVKTSLILLGLIIINFPARYYHFYWIRYATTEAMCRLRISMYRKLTKMPVAKISNEKEGTFVSKLMLDTVMFSQGFRGVIDLIREPITALFLFGVAVYRDWQLTMVMVVAAPFFNWAMKKSGKMIKDRQVEVQENMGELTHCASEGVSSQKLTKAFSLEDYSLERFNSKQKEFFRWQMKSTRVEEFTHPVTEFITGIAFISIIIFAHHRIQSDVMTPGDFVSFITAIALLIEPIKKYAAAYIKFSQAVAAGDRVFSIINESDELDSGEIQKETFTESIEVKNLNFSYTEDLQVLNDVSFKITKGQKVAFVGLSGSGKSTIMNLLLGLYPIQKNSIFIDGNSLEAVKLKSLRSLFSLVSQDVFLFNDTIVENLKLGRDISDEKLNEALKISNSLEFIRDLPDGLNTVIGDRGSKLSGGQRQRLTIARAYLFDSDILLLDEATSALDNKSEKIVQHALAQVGKGKTVIAVAHRLSTIQDFDNIFVFDQGKIIEAGTHEELISKKGQYFTLYELSKKS
jgi:ATP-binding cassette, subfamily B, bacterial MsbA